MLTSSLVSSLSIIAVFLLSLTSLPCFQTHMAESRRHHQFLLSAILSRSCGFIFLVCASLAIDSLVRFFWVFSTKPVLVFLLVAF